MGLGGCRFSDYWRFGLPITAWWFVVALVLVPLWRRFGDIPAAAAR